MKYYSLSFNNPLSKFISSFINEDETNILLKLSNDPNVYNVIPDISKFFIVDESKELIRNIEEINIRNGSIVIDDVILPFYTQEDDIYAVYDMYTIVDKDNIYNGLEYNFFYNPLISNYKKACIFNEIINNDKLVRIKNNYYIIEETILKMFRRFRLANFIENSHIFYILLDFNIPDEIITADINYDVIDMINFKNCGITNIIENNDEDINIIENDEDTGDYDNTSKISISTIKCKRNMCYYDSIPEEYSSEEESSSSEEESSSSEDEYSSIPEEYSSEEESSSFEEYSIPEEEYGIVSCDDFSINDRRRMYILWELTQFEEWRDVIIKSPEFKKYAKKYISNGCNNKTMYETVLKKILLGEIPMNTKKFKSDGYGYLFNTFRLQDNISELNDMFTNNDNCDDIINIYNTVVADPGRVFIENDYFDNYYPKSFVKWIISE